MLPSPKKPRVIAPSMHDKPTMARSSLHARRSRTLNPPGRHAAALAHVSIPHHGVEACDGELAAPARVGDPILLRHRTWPRLGGRELNACCRLEAAHLGARRLSTHRSCISVSEARTSLPKAAALR